MTNTEFYLGASTNMYKDISINKRIKRNEDEEPLYMTDSMRTAIREAQKSVSEFGGEPIILICEISGSCIINRKWIKAREVEVKFILNLEK